MSIRTVIVDNDPELLDKLTGILEDTEEIELRGRFEHPADVLAIVEREPVDLVFSDVVMPDISGITLAARLAEVSHPPKVVLLSVSRGFPSRPGISGPSGLCPSRTPGGISRVWSACTGRACRAGKCGGGGTSPFSV